MLKTHIFWQDNSVPPEWQGVTFQVRMLNQVGAGAVPCTHPGHPRGCRAGCWITRLHHQAGGDAGESSYPQAPRAQLQFPRPPAQSARLPTNSWSQIRTGAFPAACSAQGCNQLTHMNSDGSSRGSYRVSGSLVQHFLHWQPEQIRNDPYADTHSDTTMLLSRLSLRNIWLA